MTIGDSEVPPRGRMEVVLTARNLVQSEPLTSLREEPEGRSQTRDSSSRDDSRNLRTSGKNPNTECVDEEVRYPELEEYWMQFPDRRDAL